MKKKYTEPQLEWVCLFSKDIITNSPGGFVDDSDEPFMGGDIVIIG